MSFPNTIRVKEPALNGVPSTPFITMACPFAPAMQGSAAGIPLQQTSSGLLQLVGQKGYSPEMIVLLRKQLERMLEDLNYATHAKTVVFLLSPFSQKTIYLNMEMDCEMLLGDGFQTMELVRTQREEKKCLLVCVGDEAVRSYICSDGSKEPQLVMQLKIATDIPTGTFLRKLGSNMALLRKNTPYPMLVMVSADSPLKEHTLPFNEPKTVKYLTDPIPEAETAFAASSAKTFLAQWNDLVIKEAMYQLANAEKNGRLSQGLANTHYSVFHHRIQTLFVHADQDFNAFETRRIEEMCQKVLADGGQVRLLHGTLMEEYGNVAAIHFMETEEKRREMLDFGF